MPQPPIRISITYKGQRWKNLPFSRAANIIEAHVRAEKKACDTLVKKINEEHWIASFWSETLGGAEPPAYADWIKPLTTLDSARSAARGGRGDIAKRKLRLAVSEFKKVHKAWIGYRDRLDEGAKASIEAMQITIDSLATVASAGIGGGLVSGALVSGSFKMWEESAKAGGMVVQGVEKDVDVAKILKDTSVDMAKSLLIGKLGEKFLGVLAPRLSATWKLDPELAKALVKPGVGTRLEKLASEYFTTLGVNIVVDSVDAAAERTVGKGVSVSRFMEVVADEVEKRLKRSTLERQAWLQFCGKNATRKL